MYVYVYIYIGYIYLRRGRREGEGEREISALGSLVHFVCQLANSPLIPFCKGRKMGDTDTQCWELLKGSLLFLFCSPKTLCTNKLSLLILPFLHSSTLLQQMGSLLINGRQVLLQIYELML